MPGLVGARTPAATSPASSRGPCATTPPAAGASPARRRGRPAARSAPHCSACSAPTPRPSATAASPTSSSTSHADGVTVRAGRAPRRRRGLRRGVLRRRVRARRRRARRASTRAGASRWPRPARSAGLTLRSPGRFLATAAPARRARTASTRDTADPDAARRGRPRRGSTPRPTAGRRSATVTRLGEGGATGAGVEPQEGVLVGARRAPARDRARAARPARRARRRRRRGVDEGLPVRAVRARSTRAPTRSSATSSPSACSASRGSSADALRLHRRPARVPRRGARPPRRRSARRARVRAAWTNADGRSGGVDRARARWASLGALVPEAAGGLGLDELDLVLLLEETGRAALPEPFVEHAAVGAAARRRARGRRRGRRRRRCSARAGRSSPYADAADRAAARARRRSCYLVDRDDVTLDARARRSTARAGVCDVDVEPERRPRRVGGRPSAALAFDRGALGTAAQLVGLAAAPARHDRRVRRASASSSACRSARSRRSSTTSPTSRLALEFARPLVYRAAYSLADGDPERVVHVSMAKARAADAAALAGAARRSSATAPSATRSSTTSTSG